MIRLIEKSSNIYVEGDFKDIDKVKRELKYHPEGYFYSPKYTLWRETGGRQGWDGYIDLIKFVEKGKYSIPRGHKGRVIAAIKKLGIRSDLRGLVKCPTAHIIPDDVETAELVTSSFELDHNQKICVAEWMAKGIGVMRVSVNGGKSFTFAAAAAFVKKVNPNARILYLTQSERLVNQIMTSMREFLPDWHITQYGGGATSKKKNTRDKSGKDMVVSTVAMLNRNILKLIEEGWFETFFCVEFDEVHHATSKTAIKVLSQLSAYYRFGASDTSRDANKALSRTIEGLFGERLHTVTTGETIDMGRSAKPYIYVVEDLTWLNARKDIKAKPPLDSQAYCLVGNEWKEGVYKGPVFQFNEETGEVLTVKRDYFDKVEKKIKKMDINLIQPGYHLIQLNGSDTPVEVKSRWCLLERPYDKAIIRFTPRNNLIGKWAKYYSDKKYPTVVIATRTIHLLILQSVIEQQGVDRDLIRVLFSDHSTSERNETFRWIKETPGAVLITPLMKEGISINELRAGIIADYVGDWELAKQIIGRFIREKKVDNRCYITWFRDTQHPTFKDGCDELLKQLKTIRGFSFVHGITDPDSIDKGIVMEALGDMRLPA